MWGIVWRTAAKTCSAVGCVSTERRKVKTPARWRVKRRPAFSSAWRSSSSLGGQLEEGWWELFIRRLFYDRFHIKASGAFKRPARLASTSWFRWLLVVGQERCPVGRGRAEVLAGQFTQD